jgi:hypothetical protein
MEERTMSDRAVTLFRLVRRPAGSSSEELESQWARHTEFMMELPSWRHVASHSRCTVIDSEDAGREFAGTMVEYMMPDDYLGIELSLFGSSDELAQFLGHSDDRANEARHYEESFGTPQDEQYAICEEKRVIDRDGTPVLKGFTFLRRRSHLTRAEFLREWEPFSKNNIQANPGMSSKLISYVQHHGLTSLPAAESGFDGVIELAYPSFSTPIEMHVAAAKIQVRESQTFYDLTQLVSMLVDETVVSDAAGVRAGRATAVPA